MTGFPRRQLKVARVLSQDDDFAIIEVGKHENVTFHLQQDETGETVGDAFHTLVFVRATDGGAAVETWDPFAKDGD